MLSDHSASHMVGWYDQWHTSLISRRDHDLTHTDKISHELYALIKYMRKPWILGPFLRFSNGPGRLVQYLHVPSIGC